MSSAVLTTTVVAVAVLGSLYQLWLGPLIHTGGVFRKVDTLNNQECRAVSELEGCEEMVHHAGSGALYMACSRVSARPYWLPAVGNLNSSGRALDDHIATYDITSGAVTRLTVENQDSLSRGLQVHGLDVVTSLEDPSLLYLYVVNHRVPLDKDPKIVGADSVVEIFSTRVGSKSVKHLTTVDHPVIVTPNDVTGFPDGKSFYFTNDRSVKTGLYRELELWFNLSSTTVGYCHVDNGCKIAASDLKGINGITKSRVNDTIYAASSHGAGIYVFQPQEDSTLLLNENIFTYGMPMDNLSIDQNGAIWAAFFPRGLEVVQCVSDLSIKAASGAFRVTANMGQKAPSSEKYVVDRMFEDDGTIARGSTSVVHVADQDLLFLHGPSAPYLSVCKL